MEYQNILKKLNKNSFNFVNKKVLYMLNDFNESSYLMMFEINSTQEEQEINQVFNLLNKDESLEFILFKEFPPDYNLSIDFLLHRPLMTQDKKAIEDILLQIEERDKIKYQLACLEKKLDLTTNKHLNIEGIHKIFNDIADTPIYRQLSLPINSRNSEIKDLGLEKNFIEPIVKKDFNPYEPSNNKFSLFQNKKIVIFFNNILKECFKFKEEDELCLLISKYQKQFCFEEIKRINENEFNDNAFDTFLKDKVFDTKEDFNDLFSFFNKMNSETMILENKIKDNLLRFYRITESPVDCISSKTLNNFLVSILGIPSKEIISFRNKLGRILLNLGLKKKRLSDGNYYYGLVLKTDNENTKPYTLEEFKTKVETLEKERVGVKYTYLESKKLPQAISTSIHR